MQHDNILVKIMCAQRPGTATVQSDSCLPWPELRERERERQTLLLLGHSSVRETCRVRYVLERRRIREHRTERDIPPEQFFFF